jgi:fatty acid CoA ligase FadD9
LLQDIFGVEVPVHAILSPTGNPARWAQTIEAELNRQPTGMPTFAAVHGKGARQISAVDVDVAAFIDADILKRATLEPPPAVSERVLLTGATGFLGRFLCLEWLEQLTATGGKLICLVRAPHHAAAIRRLASVFAGADSTLERRYRSLVEQHLEVVVGDVAEERLGLGADEFDRLAHEADRIVHPAALVNHVFDAIHTGPTNR